MILIIFLIFLIIYLFYNNENFININESLYIDYNVIHVKNTEKKNNIINNEQILGKKINIFNGIKGDDINLNKLDMYDPNIKLNYTFKTKNELGCYLSHFLLIKNALKSKKNIQ